MLFICDVHSDYLGSLCWCDFANYILPNCLENDFLLTIYRLNFQEVQEESKQKPQPNPTPGGREKVTQINVCIANKQLHNEHKDQLPLLKAL